MDDSTVDMQSNQRQAIDLSMFLGDLALDEGASRDDVSVEVPQEEPEECKNEDAESKLTEFVDDIIVPPRMVDIIVDGEVNEEYLKTLEALSKRLKFDEVDSIFKTSKALKDVQSQLERLRQKAVSKVFEFIVQKLYALRKPKTNIQFLQQSVLLKYKYSIIFLKEHGSEKYNEVRAAYIDTMDKIISAHVHAYIQAMEKLQLDLATSSDLIGVETKSTGLFLRGKEPSKNHSSVFALGDRINILKEIDQPSL
ncbi:vacuolar protein sorting-associated protein 52 A-like, partial [Dioscorea cayenensis subsp. rotundata]|uniref:Vacuolar protein sorting-associated protein 52 A-like n=1 Tax=Dioscorea cayennensis subsp. rotundata TaxID=55577 RepID=A0AB40C3G4_DIOCR